MLILKEGDICPYVSKCPHQDGCYGAKPGRQNKFTCEFVDNGKIKLDGVRIPGDKTVKMKVIHGKFRTKNNSSCKNWDI